MSETVQTQPSTKPQRRAAAWLPFGGGLAVMALVLATDSVFDRASGIGHLPGWLQFAHNLVLPLLILSFCLCVGAPLTTTLSPSKKYAAIFAGIIAWVVILLLGAAVTLLLSGPIAD